MHYSNVKYVFVFLVFFRKSRPLQHTYWFGRIGIGIASKYIHILCTVYVHYNLQFGFTDEITPTVYSQRSAIIGKHSSNINAVGL